MSFAYLELTPEEWALKCNGKDAYSDLAPGMLSAAVVREDRLHKRIAELEEHTPAAPAVAEEKYLWSARTESDRTLLIDHHGAVIGGAVFPGDVLAIVNAHNERVRAVHPVAGSPAEVVPRSDTVRDQLVAALRAVHTAIEASDEFNGPRIDAATELLIVGALAAAEPMPASEALTDEEAFAAHPYRNLMDFDKFKAFRTRTAAPVPASEAMPENWKVREAVNRKRGSVTNMISDAAVGEVMNAVRDLMPTAAPVPASETSSKPFGYIVCEKSDEGRDEFMYRQVWDNISPEGRARHVIKIELFAAPVPADEAANVPDEIRAIAQQMRTQDNECTANPLFHVEQQRTITGIDTDYDPEIVWCIEDSMIFKGDTEFATLEAAYEESGTVPENYTRTGYIHEWDFVTPFFTRSAAERFIAQHRNKYSGPLRMSVETEPRNREMKLVRDFLESLAVSAAAGGAGSLEKRDE